jgi:succinoglycan biosynthesis transport protein ExoP
VESELNLKDIINIVWKGKTIIIGITIITLLLSVTYNVFFVRLGYETTSLLVVNKKEMNLTPFIEQVKSDINITGMIETLQLNKDQYNLPSLRKNLSIESNNDNSGMLKVIVGGTDPSAITKISNYLAFELGSLLEISDKSEVVLNSKNRILEIEETLKISNSELEQVMNALQNTPEKVLVNKSLASEPFLQSVAGDSINIDSKALGVLQFKEEEINPLYTSLKLKHTEISINIAMLMEEKKNMESKVGNDKKLTDNLIKELSEVNQDSLQVLTEGTNTIMISPALEPNLPAQPHKKMLNIAIATIIAMMISIVFVFIRNHLINDSKQKITGNGVGNSYN